MSQSDNKPILVAAISGAFGIKGEVKIKAFTQDIKACLTYGPLRDINGNVILTPKSSRLVKNALAVTTKEVTTREQAEKMKSTKLYVLRHDLPDTEEDEFYHSDLIGLKVEMLDGTPRGRVKAVHDFGAGELLEIQNAGEKDWYIPFTKAAVPRVDIAKGQIVIDPPHEIGDEAEEKSGKAKPAE